jgi:hypothetical protein
LGSLGGSAADTTDTGIFLPSFIMVPLQNAFQPSSPQRKAVIALSGGAIGLYSSARTLYRDGASPLAAGLAYRNQERSRSSPLSAALSRYVLQTEKLQLGIVESSPSDRTTVSNPITC